MGAENGGRNHFGVRVRPILFEYVSYALGQISQVALNEAAESAEIEWCTAELADVEKVRFDTLGKATMQDFPYLFPFRLRSVFFAAIPVQYGDYGSVYVLWQS